MRGRPGNVGRDGPRREVRGVDGDELGEVGEVAVEPRDLELFLFIRKRKRKEVEVFESTTTRSTEKKSNGKKNPINQ